MNKRSMWLALAMALITALVLSACQTATPAATAEATEAMTEAAPTEAMTEAAPTEAATTAATEAAGGVDESVTGKVTLWNGYSSGSAEEAALAKNIDAAKAHFPKLEIEVLQVPFDQLFNKYENEVASGGGPDMFVAPNDSLGNEARGSLVADITDLVSADALADVSATGVAGMQVDGKLYGVPESAKAVALYYNKDLVDTAPATTDELLQAVKDGKKMTMFIGAYHMFGWSGAFGGQLLDDSGKCVADQGGWADALNYLLALKAAGVEFNGDYATAETPFKNGETAFWVNGPWALGDYEKALGDKLGVAVLPVGPDGDKANPLNGIDGFYINPNSTNQEAAIALALFLSTGDQASVFTNEAGHVPIRSSVTATDPLVATFAEASAQGLPRPQSAEFGNFWTPFGDLFTTAIEGTATPEAAVKTACDAMNTANGK